MRRSAVIPLFSLLLVTGTLAAQQPSPASARVAGSRADSSRSDTTHVGTSPLDTARAQTLGRIVISGARLAPSTDPRLPQRVERVELPTISRGRVSAAEVLQRLPGVSVSNDQGSHAQPTLDLRGFTLSPVVGVPQGVSVFLDGVRVNEPDAQEVNFDLLPMEAVESAELLSGPSAVFGKNTLAGSINLRTARGGATPELTGALEIGAFGAREAHLRASGMRRGIDGLVLLSGSTDDGYQSQSGAHTRQLFVNAGRRGADADVALSLLVARNRIYEAGSLPESWLGVARRANYTGGDFFRPQLLQLGARGSWSIGGAQLRANAFGRRNAIEQLNVNASDANTRAFITNGSVGGTAELGSHVTLAGRSLDLTMGGELTRSRVEYLVHAEPNAGSPDPPAGCDAIAGGSSAVCEDARVNGDDAGVYLQGIYQATSRLALSLSARGDYSRVPFRDLREPANSGTSVFTRVSPRLGATWTLAGVRAYVSVGSAFRAPAALELACASPEAACPLPFSLGDDPPLRPVVAWNYESGVEWTSGAGAALSLSLYDTEVRDEIAFASASQVEGYFQNVPRTRRQGFETRFSALLPGDIARVSGSYTFTDATYRTPIALASALSANDVMPGDHFALSPRHRATFGVSGSHVAGGTRLDAALSARGVSSSWLRGDEANDTPPLAGYVVADLRLGARFDRVVLTASIRNLFDRRYELFGVWAENPKGASGGPAPATPSVERFLTPAYPRTMSISLGIDP